ncbi:hypothetical protein F4803DRAFT_557910 [Xylaria telfairii]|nr:hypothetical protein F4803DRAFT_557910 [Xylaria telfairii]
MAQPPPLSAQDAATLIAAAFDNAFDKHTTSIAEVVAGTMRQIQRDSQASTANNNSYLKAEETVYTDVWAFTDRLTDLATVQTEEKVKAVWTTCLQATALAWHTTELTDLEKTALSQGSVELICKSLQDRFRTSYSDAVIG